MDRESSTSDDEAAAASAATGQRRSKIAFGLAVVLVLFAGETWVADHHVPNPASPYVWTVLGLMAAGLLLAAFVFRMKATQR